ncbi:hypothetical protein [Streptomyces sp. NPDC054865]
MDTVQVIHNIFDQSPAEALFPACEEHGVGARRPGHHHRRPRGDRPALRPQRPAVSTVIPGMRTVRNVERNTAVGDGRPLSPERLAVLAKHRWERDFYS